jgi:hypothetical protein
MECLKRRLLFHNQAFYCAICIADFLVVHSELAVLALECMG